MPKRSNNFADTFMSSKCSGCMNCDHHSTSGSLGDGSGSGSSGNERIIIISRVILYHHCFMYFVSISFLLQKREEMVNESSAVVINAQILSIT